VRSFEHLIDYCDCLSVVGFLHQKGGNLLEKAILGIVAFTEK